MGFSPFIMVKNKSALAKTYFKFWLKPVLSPITYIGLKPDAIDNTFSFDSQHNKQNPYPEFRLIITTK